MLTRLILQRGERKILVDIPEIRKRKKRAKKTSSSSNISLNSTLEAPQVPSPSVEIEEVQATEVELESKSIMSGYEENHGNYKEEDVKRDFKDMQ